MNTLHNILEEMVKQKKSQKDICDFLCISKHAFSDWKSGRSNSYLKYLPQIAEYLNVSVDYLLGKEKTPTPNERDGREEKFAKLFSSLTDEQQRMIILQIQGILSERE